MNMNTIIQRLDHLQIRGEPPDSVTDFGYLPEHLQPGMLFLAMAEYLRYNQWIDGHELVAQAADRGAAAAVVERFQDIPIPQILVPDTRAAMAVLGDLVHDAPFQDMPVIGVTGTNGKTTSSHLVAAVCRTAGYSPGIIGTVGYSWADKREEAVYTTPLSADLRRLAARMRRDGTNVISMEVSSHAIKLDRIHGIPFRVGIFTNLTRDHIDFHGSMEDYRRTKRHLFELLGEQDPKATAVINADDPVAGDYAAACRVPVFTYSMKVPATVRLLEARLNLDGTWLKVAIDGHGTLDLYSHLVGAFNVQNTLAVTGAALAMGIEPSVIVEAVRDFPAVKGRFQRVDCGQDFLVIIDYAHTPDALERVLTTARSLTDKRLIAVFGCGGDRDRGKRPLMGDIAATIADLAVVTSDNPRTEPPESIIRDILAGIPAGAAFKAITDRRSAIRSALQDARPGDAVVIAGKGHETYQIIGETKHHFSDEEEVHTMLQGCGNR